MSENRRIFFWWSERPLADRFLSIPLFAAAHSSHRRRWHSSPSAVGPDVACPVHVFAGSISANVHAACRRRGGGGGGRCRRRRRRPLYLWWWSSSLLRLSRQFETGPKAHIPRDRQSVLRKNVLLPLIAFLPPFFPPTFAKVKMAASVSCQNGNGAPPGLSSQPRRTTEGDAVEGSVTPTRTPYVSVRNSPPDEHFPMELQEQLNECETPIGYAPNSYCSVRLLPIAPPYYCWLFLLHIAAAYCCWLLLLLSAVPYCCWRLLLLATAPAYCCWLRLLDTSDVYRRWLLLLSILLSTVAG